MAEIDKKLDKIPNSIKILTKRINDLDKYNLSIGNRLDILEVKIKTKFHKIDQHLAEKAEKKRSEVISKKNTEKAQRQLKKKIN